MGMGYCETNESKSKSREFVIPDFESEMEAQVKTLQLNKESELNTMLSEASIKKNAESDKYFSIYSIAKVLKCDRSALQRWVKSHGIKPKRMIMPLTNGQTSSVLTKAQVQYVMENRG